MVLDARTGEILALANAPTYNPNNRANLTGAQLRNRVFTDSFEPGSVMKPFIVGMALDAGKVKPTTVIDTSAAWIYVNRGTGYWGPPVRLGPSSEITKVVLRRA